MEGVTRKAIYKFLEYIRAYRVRYEIVSMIFSVIFAVTCYSLKHMFSTLDKHLR